MAGGLLGPSPVRALAVIFVTAGCGYHPGSFAGPRGPFVGFAATVGCLDITVSREPDSDVGPVLAFDFGNRCAQPIVVDFQHAHVEAVTGDGRRIPLGAYDPDGEIVPALLDARMPGHEAIAYTADDPVPQLCIDLATVAHVAGTQWRCLVQPEVTR
jgi:hypothetical protein